MPKGEFDTPGPFTMDDMRHFVLQNGRGVLVFAAWLDEAEHEELVGLLNKGTHFERMLEALEEAKRMFAEARGDVVATEAIHAWEATIAAAKRETDG